MCRGMRVMGRYYWFCLTWPDHIPRFEDARPCLYAPNCCEPGEYSCKFCNRSVKIFCQFPSNLSFLIRFSCWNHIIKCLGVQCGQALICCICRTHHFRGWTRRPELEAAEGKNASFAWNGAPEEWESAVGTALLEWVYIQLVEMLNDWKSE